MHRMLLLLFLLTSCISGKDNMPRQEADADSLVRYLKARVNPYFHNLQPAAAGKILDSLKPVVDQLQNFRLTGGWLRCKAVQAQIAEDFDSARYYIGKALQLAVENDTTQREVLAAKIQFADILNDQKTAFDSALQLAHEAYYLAQKIDTAGLPIICLRLAELYNSIHDQPFRRKYLFEGFHRTGNPVYQTVFANDIADYYDRVGRTDSAVYFFKTMENDTRFNSRYFLAVRYENLGSLLTKQNRLQEGLGYQLKAAAINRDIGEMDGLSFFNLAATYSKLQQFAKAHRYLDSALAMAAKENNLNLVTRAWQARAETFASRHLYAKAYAAMDSAMQHFQTEVDSSFIAAARKLEIQYAVRSKDEKIHALAVTNAANEKIRAQQRIIILALTTALVALGAVGILLWKRKQMKLQMHEAELEQQLLRSRMEPHFIFNTLAVLQSLIRNEDREKSLKYLGSFSKLLRSNLDNSRQGLVLLKEEMEALKNYLDLQVTNYENKFKYFIQVEKDVLQAGIRIPPMLLQPFVENAVIHGVSKAAWPGIISITIEKHQQVLHCMIDDNGMGLAVTPRCHSNTSSTQIIRQRLAILARQKKQSALLTVVDKQAINEGTGVKVILKIGLNGRATGTI